MNIALQTLLWGSVIGVIHFIIVGALYGNPLVDRIYKEEQERSPGVRKWDNPKEYLIKMFLGTQIEVFILTGSYLFLRGYLQFESLITAVILGSIFAGIRVYSRFWNMWIQSTYPIRMLGIEFINGTISTFIIVIGLSLLPIS